MGEQRHPHRSRLAEVAALALVGLLITPASSQAASTTFAPAADAYVSSARPGTNFGRIARLRVDGSPRLRTYVRFDVKGLGGPVARATLTLMPTSDQPRGFAVRSVADGRWGERSITFRNAPAFGSLLGLSGRVRSGTRVSIDVTPAARGDGTVTFALTTSSRRALALYSRERPRRGRAARVPFRRPQLEVETRTAPTSGLPPEGLPPGGEAPFPTTPSGDPVIEAAGDIACDPASANFNDGLGTAGSCRQKDVADTILATAPNAVLALGDVQYYCGGYGAFLQSYDLSWGRLKSITLPAVGNHEYLTSGGTGCDASNAGAAGYFRYFGAAAGDPGQGYYSYDLGGWHLIALNSQCSQAGGCSASSAQGKWLAADLAAHAQRCVLAYWHIPLFSSGGRASNNSRPFWDLLYDAGADVVLSGHDHIYERFAPQTPSGAFEAGRGIREFVVGTGGANHTALATIAANSEVRDTTTYGALKLTLHPDGYDWSFIPSAGGTFTDSGTAACHG